MPDFLYRAVSQTGEVIEGQTQAADRTAVMEWLQTLGHLPLRAEEIKHGRSGDSLKIDLLGRNSLSRKHLTLLTRELAVLLTAGLALERSFTTLLSLAQEGIAQETLEGVLEALRAGMPLADAMAQQEDAFPPYYVSMIRAGEAGGALESVLSRLADYLEKSEALSESLRSALIYPAILLVMALLSIIVLMTVVIPEFKSLFEDAGESLPWATRLVLAGGEILTQYGWPLLFGALGALWLLQRGLSNRRFRTTWDRMLLGTPLFGDLVRKFEVARFSRTLGTLTQNGVSLLNALSIAQATIGNRILSCAVDEIGERLRAGCGLAEPMQEATVFPDLAIELIRVGEETGELPGMLTKVADIYDREVQLAIDRMVTLLVPALTIGLGALIAGIIGSVVLAFLNVNELAL